jgi:hypothetical protein
MEHIGYDWGIKRSRVCQTVKWVENILIKDGTFHLHGKKVLRDGGSDIEYAVVDVTESPIERPKKTKKVLFGQEKAAYNKESGYRGHEGREDSLHSAGCRTRP